MDYDKLKQEIQRLQELLGTLDPVSEEYAKVRDELIRLAKLEMEFNETCDKEIERSARVDIERDRNEKEFELKNKEIELKNEMEAKRLDDNAADFAARRRAEKRQALWDLIKIGLQFGGSAALIIITGHTEQAVILGQHKWSLIPKGPKF